MAVIDPDANEVIVRVVYDGPPEAGKTTSMRALASSFHQATLTPEENARGRTLWFDWMEYVGGRFEGSVIRCQIVSVPGQRELDARRQALLAQADVIVFVGDTSPARWEVSLEYLFELNRLRVQEQGPVGIVFQANKRDVPQAVEIQEIRARLGDARWNIGIVESNALDGTGIRESFVYGVRLALDRVRELIASGQLRHLGHERSSAAQLLSQLRDNEMPQTAYGSSLEESLLDAVEQTTTNDDVVEEEVRVESNPDSLAATLLQDVLAAEVDAAPLLPPPPSIVSAPKPPDATVPSGAIWPPVEGRAILMEVSRLGLVAHRHANGDWEAGFGTGWQLVTKRDGVFDTLDSGRLALVQWARLHAACTGVLSPHRCIVLAATGDGRWRLWQIVRAEESLRDLVEGASEARSEVVVERLYQVSQLLIELHERVATSPCELACSLDTVGVCDASGLYVGLMPDAPVSPNGERATSSALLAKELGPLLRNRLAARRVDLERLLEVRTQVDTRREHVRASLRRMLE